MKYGSTNRQIIMKIFIKGLGFCDYGSEYHVNNNSHLLSPLIIRCSNNATNVLVGISFLVLFEYNLYIFKYILKPYTKRDPTLLNIVSKFNLIIN